LFYTWVGRERLTVRPVDMAALGSHSSGLSTTATATDFSLHTTAERPFFWQVDLREIREIAEIVIWNRGGDDQLFSATSATLVVSISVDGADWHTIQTTDPTFGSSNGTSPLRIPLSSETMVRYIKLEVNGSKNFHVDKIEAFSPVLA
jgi:F5/8 type C domain